MVPLTNITELEVSLPFPTEEVVAVAKNTSSSVGNKKKLIKSEAVYPSRVIREKGSRVWDYSGCAIPKLLSRTDGKSGFGW